MKKSIFTRIGLLLLAVVLTLCVFTACGDKPNDGTTTPGGDGPVVPQTGTLAYMLKDYKLIGPTGLGSSSPVTKGAALIEKTMNQLTGGAIEVSDDYVRRGQAVPEKNNEILVGATNRTSSKTTLESITTARANSDLDYTISILEKEVVITGGTADAVYNACVRFAEMLARPASEFSTGYTEKHTQTYDITTYGGKPIESYVIVTAAEPSEELLASATALQTAIYKASGFRLTIVTDETAEAECEIVVGDTNRAISASAKKELFAVRKNCAFDYYVATSGTKIALYGGYEPATISAVEKYAAEYVKAEYASALPASFSFKNPDIASSMKLNGVEPSDYVIVIPVNASFDIRYDAYKLSQYFLTKCGYYVNVVTDDSPEAEHEIILGKTSRKTMLGADSIDAYKAAFVGGDLVFDAGHYYGVTLMVKNFLNQYDDVSNPIVVAGSYTQSGKVTNVQLEWENNGAAIKGFAKDVQESFDDVTRGLNGKNKLTLVWNEEFDGKAEDQFDAEKITLRAGMNTNGCYNRTTPDVVCLDGEGNLVLHTYIWDEKAEQIIDPDNLPEGYTLSADNKEIKNAQGSTVWKYDSELNRYITNTSVNTSNTMNFLYGYLEMRAKVPAYGMGEWTSFWATSGHAVMYANYYYNKYGESLTDNTKYGIEIDFFEVFSSLNPVANMHKWYRNDTPERPNPWYGYLTQQGSTARDMLASGNNGAGQTMSGDRVYTGHDGTIATKYHTHGFFWTKDIMSFAVDGNFYYTWNLNEDFGLYCYFDPTTNTYKSTGKNGGGERSGMLEFGARDTTTGEIDWKKVEPLSIIINNQMYADAYIQSEGGAWGRSNIPQLALFQDGRFTYTIDYLRLYQIADYDMLCLTPDVIGKGKKVQ